MRRSQIDNLIEQALNFFGKHNFQVPKWAGWTAKDWSQAGAEANEVRNHGLGWNLTDFGSGDFEKMGLLLFIIRNGWLVDNKPVSGKTYAEKAMIVRPGQLTPWHFHWHKTEDLLNRGGGRLEVELGWASEDEKSVSDAPVVVKVDGIERKLKAGEKLILEPGESVCIPPRLCHQFCGHPKDAAVLAGEVSSLNDDSADNCFMCRCVSRTIEEDADKKYLLLSDYLGN
jgi:D-lyxose ketol-isomerase